MPPSYLLIIEIWRIVGQQIGHTTSLYFSLEVSTVGKISELTGLSMAQHHQWQLWGQHCFLGFRATENSAVTINVLHLLVGLIQAWIDRSGRFLRQHGIDGVFDEVQNLLAYQSVLSMPGSEDVGNHQPCAHKMWTL